MVNSKSDLQKFSIIMLLLITVAITIGCMVKLNTDFQSIETSTLNNDDLKDISSTGNINIVVIRKNELLSVSLNGKNITLDSGGSFSRPLISPNKKYVSYIKDKNLYITTDKHEHIKVAHNPIDLSFALQLSFAWKDENTLLYSPTSGGLYSFDVVNKISKPYLANKYNYQNITLDVTGGIYAEQYLYYKKNNSYFINDYGVLFFNPVSKEEKIVIKSIPNKMDTGGDLGMYPIISGISNDYKYLYVWKHPHSGSIAADGVPLAVYDILNNKLIEYENPNIISLAYKDNISPNPKNSRFLALVSGEGRFMGNNKHLIILNILTGKFQSIPPKEYAFMTPNYSGDGKTILYASSKEASYAPGNIAQWLLSGNHHIFSIDTTTKQIIQLTSNSNYFDFSPIYVNNKDMIFFRSDKTENVSLWKSVNGQETMLTDGIIFYNDMDFPVQNYYGHFNTTLFTDIKY
ncbi:hypothetical protein [Clostridium lacusfryxellense]|uniref:hypothetical protein n=1 Tax=Clostridium lacusfryxellense TaxID=205328 RepID=UPI001C0AEA87|nr:hypothetical protein [Clostridium lacusfryxellense]MBU3113758.1 hypothetical protein [Clostridium lacusfryxellense]